MNESFKQLKISKSTSLLLFSCLKVEERALVRLGYHPVRGETERKYISEGNEKGIDYPRLAID